MGFPLKIFIILITAVIALTGENAFAQQPESSTSGEVIILNDNIPVATTRTLNYIGEIKGHSYIKITLEPVNSSAESPDKNSNMLEYKGAYYEAVNGKTYAVKGAYNSDDHSWYIKCYNKKGQFIYSFQGRETAEDIIEGTWKSKHRSATFYLFKKVK